MPQIHDITSSSTSFNQNHWLFIEKLSDPMILIKRCGLILTFNTSLQKWLAPLGLHIKRCSNIQLTFRALHRSIKFPQPGEQYNFITYIHPYSVETSISCHSQSEIFIISFKNGSDHDILQTVIDSIPARVFWKNIDGKYLGSNQLFANDCGVKHYKDLVGKSDIDFFNQREADNFIADDKEVMRSGIAKLNIEEPQTRVDGEIFWLQTNKVPLKNIQGKVIGIMGSYTDITERKKYQHLIERQARFDHLTGLPNRLALQEKLDKSSTTEQRVEKQNVKNSNIVMYSGLLFIDLDQFKTINDSLGHKVGDELLKDVSKRIVASTQNKGFVVRLGGDEFSVLLKNFSENSHQNKKNLQNLAHAIRDTIIQPYYIGPHIIQIGVSIGISEFTSNNVDWEKEFNESDIAMYEAKSAGRNNIAFFTESMRDKVNYKHQLQTNLSFACRNKEFFLAIQPQFDRHREWIGGESLLRWSNLDLGVIPPSKFIPISEQSGIIHNIGSWLFEHAFELIHQWSLSCDKKRLLPLAINVSTKQFEQDNFIPQIENLLDKYAIDASLIQFELTESALLENKNDALKKMFSLNSMGFTVAVDDFGTGYSCLGYISKLPIHKIKIDRSFTIQMTRDKRQARVVETIINMAKGLGIGVIAEGVETKEQLELLVQSGCNEFQGYYFSHPVSELEYSMQTLNKFFAH